MVSMMLALLSGCASVEDPYAFEKRRGAVDIEADVMTQAVMGRRPLQGQQPLTGPMGGGVGADARYMDQHEEELKARLDQTGVSVERIDDSIRLIMPGNITFATDSHTLAQNFLPILDGVADVLSRFEFTALEVSGHTDSRGKKGYNLKLSEARAQAVASYLKNTGISAGRIRTIAQGEAKPIASNKTEKGRAQNRRVELKIMPR
ncbi:hypothetical protein BGP75_07530 [Motiliproteus sp. MSK22-1]|nr:hypothetical protein BGP75_07530 [Motiliproteus sp. MSK22-1]